MRTTRLVLALSTVTVFAVEACVAQVNPTEPGVDGGLPDLDGALPFIDAAGLDAGTRCPPGSVAPTGRCAASDASPGDAAAPDATIPDEASAPDASVADAAADVTDEGMDSTAPLDSGADAIEVTDAIADAGGGGPDVVDAGPDVFDAGPDVFDAGADVFDAGPDVFDAGADAFDAGPVSCVAAVFGDYYTRTDGSVVQGPTKTVIVDDTTGLPLTGVTQVFDDVYSACALRGTDQTVWCWPTFGGSNTSGQLGNGTFTDVTDSAKYYRATEVETAHPDGGAAVYLDQVTSITSGSEGGYVTAICAVRSDRSLWCWGPATQGHLWQGTLGSSADLAFATPIRAGTDAGAFITNVDQVSVGNRHVCFLSGGGVYCWGNNTGGELGTGDTADQTYPFHVTANLPATVDTVAAEEDQTCVLASQQVYCWGADTYTSEGDPNVPTSICNSNYCQPLPVPVQRALPDGGVSSNPLTNVATLFVGYQFACALDLGGNILCWGQWSGTPVIYKEAAPFVNPLGSTPSGPASSLSSIGTGGFGSSLRYLTTSGVLVRGSQPETTNCQ